jgi:hypothetical protein
MLLKVLADVKNISGLEIIDYLDAKDISFVFGCESAYLFQLTLTAERLKPLLTTFRAAFYYLFPIF